MSKKNTIAILGAGFIGKSLIRYFLSKDADIRVLDHNECPEEFANKVTWIKADFADRDAVYKVLDANVDVAYHLVSSTVPGIETGKKIIQELYDNVFTTIEFINVCIEVKVKRVVFVSSSSVYGIQKSFPIKESAETNPISAHGIQKLTLEKYFQFFQFTEGIDVKIVRLSNPYGPGQNINGRQGFIAIVIGNIIRDTEVLIRNQGSAVRDYIYIDDVTEMLQRVGLDLNSPSVVNIGSGVPHTLVDVLEIVENISGKSVKRISGENRNIDIPESVLDIELAINELGFTPKISLQEGIERTLRFHGVIK